MHEVRCVYPDGKETRSVAATEALQAVVLLHKQHKMTCTLYVDGELVHQGISKQQQ